MSAEHDNKNQKTLDAVTQDDASSQALSDALRSSFRIVEVVMVVLVVVFLCSGFFTVEAQHKAIILRFGKPVGQGPKALLDPGPHWAFPAPIDEVVRIPANQSQSANSTVGWYATTPEMEATHTEPPVMPTLNPAMDSYSLTADANIVHARAMVRYRITDPIRYYFEFANAAEFVTNALNNALYYASARFTVDDVLTRRATAFRETVAKRLSDLIDEQNLGIVLEQTDVQAIPPRQLQAKFNEVLQASVKRDDALNKAKSYENEVLSKAKAEAQGRINIAQADRDRLVSIVSAEAQKFNELLPEYQRDPALFTRVRQIETLERVMTNVQEKFYVRARSDGRPSELRLQLGREPVKPSVPAPAQP